MRIRRPVTALLAALALTGGGGLTACNGPISNTGTPMDNAPTSQQNPRDASQGHLPIDSNRVTSSGADRAGGNGKGEP